MRVFVIVVLLFVLAVTSALGFKVLLEPMLTKKPRPTIESLIKDLPRDISGFGIDRNEATPSASESAAPALTVSSRPDKKAIFLTFENLANVSAIDYTVTYVSKGLTKGITGTVDHHASSESSMVREILLGTCSQNVCTYDEGVGTITVVATFTLKDSLKVKVEKTHTL